MPTSLPTPPTRGFALLLVVTLLAFIVLLLVSLATLTRVETQLAGNQQQLSQARQNALAALTIALGELQKYAGPDQRVTAPADLVADHDAAGNATSAPSALAVQNGTRHWTGVWGNGATSISYALTPDQIIGRGTAPVLLNWLVSGNEPTTYTLAAANGRVAPGTAPRFTPSLALTNLAAASTPASTLRPQFASLPSAADGVLLVGANSTSDGTSADATTSFGRGDYVVAPLVDIRVPSSLVPGGVSAASDTLIGRYAWWIGDEGVKARINLQNGYQRTGVAADQINSFVVSQRSALEVMEGNSANTPVGTAFDFTNPDVPRLTTSAQLSFLGTNTTNTTTLALAARHRFHDLTSTSNGVLADSYAGGLKKDLSADLADTSSDFTYRPADSAPVFTPISTSEINLPTWGNFRDWARTNPDTNGRINPISAQAERAGISPVVLFVGMGMDYYLGSLEGAGRRFIMAFYPMVVLYNPYSWPIKATDYDVGIRFGNYSGVADSHNTFRISLKKAAVSSYTEYAYVDLNALAIYPKATPPAGLTNSFFRLRISAKDKNGTAQDIPPGERFAYMLTTSDISEYNHASPPELRRVEKISDETTNYFTLTSAPIPTALDDPTDNIILLGNKGTATTDQGQGLRFMESSVVLADANALASPTWPTSSATFRSAILNVFTNSYGSVNLQQFCQLESDPSPVTIGDRILTESPKAKTTFRMMSVNEARGAWGALDRSGSAPNIPIIRHLADANLRAPFVAATAFENASALSVGATSGTGYRHSARPFSAVIQGGIPDATSLSSFPGVDLDFDHYGFGFRSPHDATAGTTPRAILFDLLGSSDLLLSLGQLQHVPWARYSFNTSYPFANSYAALRVARDSTYRSSGVRRPNDLLVAGATVNPTDPLYDLSWHLNRAIWDKYFVSGVPPSLPSATSPLPNARMSLYSPNGGTPTLDDIRYSGTGSNKAYDQAAASLLVKGAFNINSTSEQAWRAVLAGSKGLKSDLAYAAPADGVDTAIPYPRFRRNITSLTYADGPYQGLASTMNLPSPSAGSQPTKIEIGQHMHSANRGLYLNNPLFHGNTSAQAVVAELARSIVNEIRLRGPFLSLADFINRPITATNNPLGIKGTLQAGLDNMDPATAQVNPDSLLLNPDIPSTSNIGGMLNAPAATSKVVTDYKWDPEHYIGRSLTGRGNMSSASWAMSPIQITQADLLSSLGPMLSARSDTFIIRTYGETINPATNVTEGRAWCEAVVQRLPDYTGGEAAITSPANLTTSSSQTFGRKFKIISFRWLSPSDI